jgi:hypothetical protein
MIKTTDKGKTFGRNRQFPNSKSQHAAIFPERTPESSRNPAGRRTGSQNRTERRQDART